MDCGTYWSRWIWSLTLISVRDLPGNVFIKAPAIHPELAHGARQLWDGFPSLYKDISWEVPDKN